MFFDIRRKEKFCKIPIFAKTRLDDGKNFVTKYNFAIMRLCNPSYTPTDSPSYDKEAVPIHQPTRLHMTRRLFLHINLLAFI